MPYIDITTMQGEMPLIMSHVLPDGTRTALKRVFMLWHGDAVPGGSGYRENLLPVLH